MDVRVAALVGCLAACAGTPEPEPQPEPAPESAVDRAALAKPVSRAAKPRPYVSDRERLEAIGSLLSLGEVEQRLYAPGDFTPLERPKPGHWLAEHPERGQRFAAFAKGRYPKSDGKRRYLYLMPLSYPATPYDPEPKTLAKFAEQFFGVPVKLTRPVDADSMKITSRPRKTGRQLLSTDVLDQLKKRIPDDGFLLIALTGIDLYPAADWNFVFGQATLRDRVAVYSTARYQPSFYGVDGTAGNIRSIILQRTLKIMSHEVGHMFGMEHCVFYRCIMNGSNSLLETDRSPHHLCPVCLRKLASSSRFDLVDRYRGLGEIYDGLGMKAEAAFVRERIEGL